MASHYTSTVLKVKNRETKHADELLFQMISNSKRSDREIAKILRISQPSVTRKRKILENEGYIKEYTVIPDLQKMGYEILAFTFLQFSESRPELFTKAREWVKKRPCVIFSHNGEGFGMNSTVISLHKDYSAFSKLITQLREDWQPNLRNIQSFIVSIKRKDLSIKPFSLRYLESCVCETKE